MSNLLNLYNKYTQIAKRSSLNTRSILDIFEYVLDIKIGILKDELKRDINFFKYLKLKYLLDRFINEKPVEYITHKAYFYGLELYVNKNVLIPEDETEELVNWVLSDFPNQKINVIDLCSGSGCIGLSLKKKCDKFNVTCIDISKKANRVAKYNANLNNLDINIIQNDLLENYDKDFDILVSNPPYIYYKDNDVSKSVRKYEPSIALFVKDKEGISIYKRIFDELDKKHFKAAYFEIGYNQKEPLTNLLANYKFKFEFRKDINNKDRMLKIEKLL